MDPDISAVRLAEVVKRFYGFWAANEPVIERWTSQHSVAASSLEWSRRRRTDVLARDLVILGVPQGSQSALPKSSPIFAAAGQPEVFGWLYVTEGSTLGGAIVDRHLRGASTSDGAVLACFAPYQEGPGPVWQSYRSALQAFANGHSRRAGAVIAAAMTTFESLERWMAPLDARPTA